MFKFNVAISFLFEDFIARLTSKECSERLIGFMILQKSNQNKLYKEIHRSCQYSVHSSKEERERIDKRGGENAVKSGYYFQPPTPKGSA